MDGVVWVMLILALIILVWAGWNLFTGAVGEKLIDMGLDKGLKSIRHTSTARILLRNMKVRVVWQRDAYIIQASTFGSPWRTVALESESHVRYDSHWRALAVAKKVILSIEQWFEKDTEDDIQPPVVLRPNLKQIDIVKTIVTGIDQ